MRRIGYLPGEICVCLGSMGSDESSSTSNETTNNQIALQAAPNSTQLAISGSSGVSITSADPEVVRGAVNLAEAVANSSAANVTYALQALQSVQDRAAASVDRAVDSAQTIALTATPPSAGALAEISSSQLRSTLLVTGAGIALLFLVTRKK